MKVQLDKQYLEVLHLICKRILKLNLAWAITGSCGFAMHGMDVRVNDIDIQTDREGAFAIEKALDEYVMQRVSLWESKTMKSYFGVLVINGIKVEIMGAIQKYIEGQGWEDPVDVKKYKKVIDIDQVKIPVLSLEYEESAYRATGREDKADEIMAYLGKNRANSL